MSALNDIAASAVARWSDPDTQPLFKGRLIDSDFFDDDGNFTGNIDGGCACAQGDILLHSGFSPQDLRTMGQIKADEETARLLGISITHAILLRSVNDSEDGCPQDVLTNPEKILGPHAPKILGFWLHLDRMTSEQWRDARDARAARAARDVAYAAVAEIAGAKWLPEHERGEFVFLPMFGFPNPDALVAA